MQAAERGARGEAVVVGVQVADPRRFAVLVLIILLILAVALALSFLTSAEPVPIGRT